jgi:hypothetical protein
MTLRQLRKGFRCNAGDDATWYMDAKVSGHFREGGTADFILGQLEQRKPTLELSGWNIDREDPCAAGSASGTAACVLLENSLIYQALSCSAERAYQLLLEEEAKNPPSFNPATFAATVDRFCYDRERDSGGGGWPVAHGARCKNRILRAKFKEFLSWHECMQTNRRKRTLCTFPNMDFNKEDDEAE